MFNKTIDFGCIFHFKVILNVCRVHCNGIATCYHLRSLFTKKTQHVIFYRDKRRCGFIS